MIEVVLEGALLFTLCLVAHVIVWRVRRPQTYRTWLPWLVAIFLIAGPAAEWRLTRTTTAADLMAVLLMHGAMSMVYIIGYTLISAFSPSIEILRLLERTPGGLRRDEIQLPYLQTALGGNRVANLMNDGLIRAKDDRVSLEPNGRLLATLVLFYRHTIGLPDGAGG